MLEAAQTNHIPPTCIGKYGITRTVPISVVTGGEQDQKVLIIITISISCYRKKVILVGLEAPRIGMQSRPYTVGLGEHIYIETVGHFQILGSPWADIIKSQLQKTGGGREHQRNVPVGSTS